MRSLERIRRARWLPFVVSLLPPLVAIAIQFAVWEVLSPYAWMIFYPAIIASAWLGGLRQGLIATAVSTAVVWWFFVPPTHALWKDDAARVIPACIFLGLGAVVSAALGRLRTVNRELHRAVQERRLFAALVDASSDFIGVADTSGRPTYLNPAGRRMVGLGPDEPIEDRSLLDFFPAEERAAAQVALDQFATLERWEGETRLQNFATGAVFPVSLTRFSISDPDTGQPLGRGNVSRDISKTKELERSLRELSSDLTRAQQVAGVGSWRFDLAAKTSQSSPETLRLLGLPHGTDLTGELFFSRVHPDDRAFVVERWAAAAAGEPYDIEFRVITDGAPRWVHAKADVEVDVNGNPVSGIGTLQDVTAAKRAEIEQRFLADLGAVLSETLDLDRLLANLGDLVVREVADFCVIDVAQRDGKLTRARASCRAPADRWICDVLEHVVLDRGKPYLVAETIATSRSVLVPDVSPELIDSFAHSAEHRTALRALGARSLLTVPLVARGTFLGAIGLVASRSSLAYGPDDLQLAEELARRAALWIDNARLYLAAQSAVRTRDEVLGIVAHDLRNPLNTITLYSAIVRDNAQPHEKSADAIGRAARRMNRLIEDLLDVTRLEGDRIELDRRAIGAAQLVREAAEAQRQIAAAAALELHVDVASDVPTVWADRDRVLQILDNLIGNAIKFTDRGGFVTIGAATRGGDVTFWVADSGRGIAPDDQPHVFDRFWQGTSATRKRGAGLGLAIAKGLVEAHGGRVWLESALGRGTTVFFTIPAAAAQAVQSAATPA
ncbi:MAG TPA: ATP-binding protein [Kofleriaceae bacterium]|nr:ATP-binding protein [Kofleriaceae bacterium]